MFQNGIRQTLNRGIAYKSMTVLSRNQDGGSEFKITQNEAYREGDYKFYNCWWHDSRSVAKYLIHWRFHACVNYLGPTISLKKKIIEKVHLV